MGYLISALGLTLSCILLLLHTGFAKEIIEIDQTAPTLSYIPKSESIESGKALEISIQATDNQNVKRVTLFYRLISNGEYHSAEMIRTDQDHYAYVIPGDEIYGERLEYYFTAEDNAGNRTMKGFSATPLLLYLVPVGKNSNKKIVPVQSARHSLVTASYSNNALVFTFGESLIRLADQGNQLNVPSYYYGAEGQFPYKSGFEFDIGLNGTHSDSIKMNWVVYQNQSGTLYESLDTFSVYAGQRFCQKETSFLIGVNYLTARINDRNLLNSSGFRITRFADENYNQTGAILGIGWHYPVSSHFYVGIDPKLNIYFTGQLNSLSFPIEIRYEF
ncbi:MAG: hypothetical protein HY200_00810 [Nitrospirae bacterium]|nr:hypothetical protein [Nitrospirota bacterium]MBI3593478.1 hypothetical protein [Nitrospirota bacterium]